MATPFCDDSDSGYSLITSCPEQHSMLAILKVEPTLVPLSHDSTTNSKVQYKEHARGWTTSRLPCTSRISLPRTGCSHLLWSLCADDAHKAVPAELVRARARRTPSVVLRVGEHRAAGSGGGAARRRLWSSGYGHVERDDADRSRVMLKKEAPWWRYDRYEDDEVWKHIPWSRRVDRHSVLVT